MWYERIAESNLIPDPVIRRFARRLVRAGLRRLDAPGTAERQTRKQALVEKLRGSPIALHVEAANEQHYELPAEFFGSFLGRRLKYSACYWPEGIDTLDDAEEAMLHLTCLRAGLEDGMDILDLGCGWGSLALWVAERYPKGHIVAVSNSVPQRAYIEARCRERGFGHLEVITADVAAFEPARQFDRIVSVEMFEHMKNYERLMGKIAGWLKPGGKLFVHHFSHREHAYEFDHTDPSDWMARHFFTGGTMPSDDLLAHFQRDLRAAAHWRVDGTHYTRTLNAWLRRFDAAEGRIRPILRDVYGPENEERWFANWRIFFIACAETFGIEGGSEYLITHRLFERPT